MPTMDEIVRWVESHELEYVTPRRSLADDMESFNRAWQLIVAEMIHDYIMRKGYFSNATEKRFISESDRY